MASPTDVANFGRDQQAVNTHVLRAFERANIDINNPNSDINNNVFEILDNVELKDWEDFNPSYLQRYFPYLDEERLNETDEEIFDRISGGDFDGSRVDEASGLVEPIIYFETTGLPPINVEHFFDTDVRGGVGSVTKAFSPGAASRAESFINGLARDYPDMLGNALLNIADRDDKPQLASYAQQLKGVGESRKFRSYLQTGVSVPHDFVNALHPPTADKLYYGLYAAGAITALGAGALWGIQKVSSATGITEEIKDLFDTTLHESAAGYAMLDAGGVSGRVQYPTAEHYNQSIRAEQEFGFILKTAQPVVELVNTALLATGVFGAVKYTVGKVIGTTIFGLAAVGTGAITKGAYQKIALAANNRANRRLNNADSDTIDRLTGFPRGTQPSDARSLAGRLDRTASHYGTTGRRTNRDIVRDRDIAKFGSYLDEGTASLSTRFSSSVSNTLDRVAGFVKRNTDDASKAIRTIRPTTGERALRKTYNAVVTGGSTSIGASIAAGVAGSIYFNRVPQNYVSGAFALPDAAAATLISGPTYAMGYGVGSKDLQMAGIALGNYGTSTIAETSERMLRERGFIQLSPIVDPGKTGSMLMVGALIGMGIINSRGVGRDLKSLFFKSQIKLLKGTTVAATWASGANSLRTGPILKYVSQTSRVRMRGIENQLSDPRAYMAAKGTWTDAAERALNTKTLFYTGSAIGLMNPELLASLPVQLSLLGTAGAVYGYRVGKALQLPTGANLPKVRTGSLYGLPGDSTARGFFTPRAQVEMNLRNQNSRVFSSHVPFAGETAAAIAGVGFAAYMIHQSGTSYHARNQVEAIQGEDHSMASNEFIGEGFADAQTSVNITREAILNSVRPIDVALQRLNVSLHSLISSLPSGSASQARNPTRMKRNTYRLIQSSGDGIAEDTAVATTMGLEPTWIETNRGEIADEALPRAMFNLKSPFSMRSISHALLQGVVTPTGEERVLHNIDVIRTHQDELIRQFQGSNTPPLQAWAQSSVTTGNRDLSGFTKEEKAELAAARFAIYSFGQGHLYAPSGLHNHAYSWMTRKSFRGLSLILTGKSNTFSKYEHLLSTVSAGAFLGQTQAPSAGRAAVQSVIGGRASLWTKTGAAGTLAYMMNAMGRTKFDSDALRRSLHAQGNPFHKGSRQLRIASDGEDLFIESNDRTIVRMDNYRALTEQYIRGNFEIDGFSYGAAAIREAEKALGKFKYHEIDFTDVEMLSVGTAGPDSKRSSFFTNTTTNAVNLIQLSSREGTPGSITRPGGPTNRYSYVANPTFGPGVNLAAEENYNHNTVQFATLSGSSIKNMINAVGHQFYNHLRDNLSDADAEALVKRVAGGANGPWISRNGTRFAAEDGVNFNTGFSEGSLNVYHNTRNVVVAYKGKENIRNNIQTPEDVLSLLVGGDSSIGYRIVADGTFNLIAGMGDDGKIGELRVLDIKGNQSYLQKILYGDKSLSDFLPGTFFPTEMPNKHEPPVNVQNDPPGFFRVRPDDIQMVVNDVPVGDMTALSAITDVTGGMFSNLSMAQGLRNGAVAYLIDIKKRNAYYTITNQLDSSDDRYDTQRRQINMQPGSSPENIDPGNINRLIHRQEERANGRIRSPSGL